MQFTLWLSTKTEGCHIDSQGFRWDAKLTGKYGAVVLRMVNVETEDGLRSVLALEKSQATSFDELSPILVTGDRTLMGAQPILRFIGDGGV